MELRAAPGGNSVSSDVQPTKLPIRCIWQDKWMGKRGGAIVEFGYTMSNNQMFAKGRRPLPHEVG